MSDFGKNKFNKTVESINQNEFEEKYESGNITFFPAGAKTQRQIEIARYISEAVSPYLDIKIQIRYQSMNSEYGGMNAILDRKFRDENYYDSITINPDHPYQEELSFIILHELGHSFEEKIEQMIKDKNIEALPVGIDENYADFYADLIAVYIMKPDLLKKIENLPIAQNTVLVIKEMFKNKDFVELRNKLNDTTYQDCDFEKENQNTEQFPKLPDRVFYKIDEYIKQ